MSAAQLIKLGESFITGKGRGRHFWCEAKEQGTGRHAEGWVANLSENKGFVFLNWEGFRFPDREAIKASGPASVERWLLPPIRGERNTPYVDYNAVTIFSVTYCFINACPWEHCPAKSYCEHNKQCPQQPSIYFATEWTLSQELADLPPWAIKALRDRYAFNGSPSLAAA